MTTEIVTDGTKRLTTWLFVTATDDAEIASAVSSGADCVIVDLEDFTPPQLRERGRGNLANTLSQVRESGAVACVRINPTGSKDHKLDSKAALDAGAEIISLPKTTSAEELKGLAGAMKSHPGDQGGSPGLLPCIETAEGLVNTYSILKHGPEVVACLIASEDMTASLGAPRDRSGRAIKYARERFIVECRAAGVEPVDCPYTWSDTDGLVAETREAKALGYHAKSAARADQISVIKELLEPNADEIAAAKQLVEAFEAAQAAGQDRVEVDGRIAEQPSYLNALAVLDRARD